MNEKLLQQAMAMFDSQEKWDAFLELCYQKSKICEIWRCALINRLKALFGSEVDSNEFVLYSDLWTIVCKSKRLGDDFQLHINTYHRKIHIFLNDFNKYDAERIRLMIKNNQTLMSLLKDFEYSNDDNRPNWIKPFTDDICCISYEKNTEPALDRSTYMWGHDTERVANVIFETYMRPFMTDKIADIFVEICEATKK